MNKAQIAMIENLLTKRMIEQGLTFMKDVQEGQVVSKWNTAINAPETDAHGKPITFKLVQKQESQAKGYWVLTYEQDGKVYKNQAGFMDGTIFKVVG